MPTDTTANTGRIDGVQLMRVGTWDASTGKTSITKTHLTAAVQAFSDKLIDRAPIKIGHTDDRFQDADGAPPVRDGQPAYGWIENMRLADNGDALVGDLVGIPAKLAKIIPTAFRRRSVEIAFKLRSAAGKVYDAAITGLALLGEAPPAVKGLDDVLALYTASGQPAFGGITTVEFADSDTPNIPHTPSGSADADRHDTKTTAEGLVKIDPKLMDALGLAEDASDDDVRKALADSGLTLIDGGKPDADGGTGVDAGDGKPDASTDATGDAGKAADAAADGKTADDTSQPAPTGQAADTGGQVAGQQPAAVAASESADAQSPVTTIAIETAALSALQADAKAGREARAQQVAERRDRKITAALSAGRIIPEKAGTWREALDVAEDVTTRLLENQPQVVPVTEFGYSAPTDAQVKATEADDKRAAATFIGMGE